MSRRPALSPRKNPRQSRSAATVDAIVEATAQVLSARGYEGATTARIAERAGTSVGSLYQYFPTKEALLNAVAQRHLGDMLEVFQKLVPHDVARAPLEEAIRALVKAALEAHAADPAGMIATHPDIRSVDAELAAYIIVRSVESLTHSAVLEKPELLARPDFLSEVTHLVVAYLKKS